MAYTIENNYTGNGSTRLYSFTFPYLEDTDVKVSLNQVDTTNFTLANATQIQFSADSGGATSTQEADGSPKSSVAIRIYRDTNIDNLQSEFFSGSAVRAQDLNNDFNQTLYVSQETEKSVEGKWNDSTQTIDSTEAFIDSDSYIMTAKAIDDRINTNIASHSLTDGKIWVGNGSNVSAQVTPSGDVTMANTGAFTIANTSVETGMLANDAVTGAKIADDTIDSEHYAADSIDTEHYAPGSVDSTAIADGTIVNTDISGSAAIAHSKLASLTDGRILVGNGSNVPVGVSVSGDVTLANTGAVTIATGAVEHAMLAADAVDGDNIADDSIDSEHYVNGSIDAAHIANDAIDSQHYAAGSIDNEHLADDAVGADELAANAVVNASVAASAAIDHSKLANVTDGSILVGNGSNVPTAVAVSGDVTLANTGAITIANDAVEIGMLGCEQTTISDSDSHIPTSGAVVDYVASVVGPIGGFEVIADDESFPNTIPAAGVVVSITDAAGLSVNSSGVSTNGDALDNSTITINGFPSELRGGVGGNADPYVFGSGAGLMVVSTGSSQTYNYHQAMIREADFVQLSDDINDFNNRYRIGTRTADSASSNDDGDLFFDTGTNKMYVYDGAYDAGGAWKEVTSAGDFKILTIKDHDEAVGGAGPTYGSNVEFDLFDGSADASITTASQLIVVLNGVVQKPNAAYSGSMEGFSLNDTHGIKFATAPPSGSSMFVTQIGTATTISTPGTGSISNANMFAAGVINAAAIGTGAVEHAKLGADCVDGDNIQDDVINSEHYVAASIDHEHLANDCVDGDNLADNACDSEHYTDGSIDHEHLANDCVDGDNIADNSIGLEHLAGGTDGNLITYDASGDPAFVTTGTSGHVLTSNGTGAAPTFQAASGGRIYRNIVVNGAMNVAQRATSSTSSGYKTIDRIKVDTGNLGQTCTVSQRALTSADTGPFAKGFRNCLKIALASADSAAANKYIQWGYRVESRDIATSGWDYGNASSNLNVSFWIKVSAAQTFYLMIEGNNTGTNRFYVKPFTPSGTSWEKISLSIPGDASTTGFNNDNATGANFWIMPYYGTDYTATGTINSWHDGNASTSMPDMASTWLTTGTPVFEVTGYQIEAGDEATEFEFKSLTQDLVECYRYCQGSKGDSSDFLFGPGYEDQNGSFYMPLMFRPPMRASPSMVLHNGGWKQNTPGYDSSEYTNAMSVYDPQPGPIFTAVLCWKDTDISSSVNRAGTCWMRASQSDTRICMEAEL